MNESDQENFTEEPEEIIKLDENTVVSKKTIEKFSSAGDSTSEDSDIEMVPTKIIKNKSVKPIVIDDGDSEEEETVMLN